MSFRFGSDGVATGCLRRACMDDCAMQRSWRQRTAAMVVVPRSEAKLLQRLPSAARLAAAAHSGSYARGGGVGGGKGLPVTCMDGCVRAACCACMLTTGVVLA